VAQFDTSRRWLRSASCGATIPAGQLRYYCKRSIIVGDTCDLRDNFWQRAHGVEEALNMPVPPPDWAQLALPPCTAVLCRQARWLISLQTKRETGSTKLGRLKATQEQNYAGHFNALGESWGRRTSDVEEYGCNRQHDLALASKPEITTSTNSIKTECRLRSSKLDLCAGKLRNASKPRRLSQSLAGVCGATNESPPPLATGAAVVAIEKGGNYKGCEAGRLLHRWLINTAPGRT